MRKHTERHHWPKSHIDVIHVTCVMRPSREFYPSSPSTPSCFSALLLKQPGLTSLSISLWKILLYELYFCITVSNCDNFTSSVCELWIIPVTGIWKSGNWELGIEVGAIKFRRHEKSWWEGNLGLGTASLMPWEEGQGVSMGTQFLRTRGGRFRNTEPCWVGYIGFSQSGGCCCCCCTSSSLPLLFPPLPPLFIPIATPHHILSPVTQLFCGAWEERIYFEL